MGTFTGTTGDDSLSGGPGPDTLIGLTGNDTYIVNDPGDAVVENPGEGYDVIFTSVNYALTDFSEVEGLVPLDFNGTTPLSLRGNGLANYILGNAGANTLSGGAGADILEARAGDDTLDGGTGADRLIGGQGNDIYIIDNVGDVTIEAVGQGYDVAYASISCTLAAGQEIEGLVALDFNSTAALDFTGNELSNYLIGNAGANQLSGGAGADVMEGRGGNDIYLIDNSGDAVIEAVGQGYDVAYTSVSFTLAAGWSVEGLVALDFNSTATLNLTGNELDNYMIANAGANLLIGGAGSDTLEGRAGDDTLNGGSGADRLFGGQGNDHYYIDNAGDAITELAGEGYDIAYVTTSYALAAGSEVEGLSTLDWNGTSAINLTGNAIANYIIGNAGANTLDGGAGVDVMYGKGGDDIYLVDNAQDGAFENAGEGNDTVLATVSYAVAAGQSVEVLAAFDPAGQSAINLTGNALTQLIRGNAGDNILVGHAAGTTFSGGLGADTLDSSGQINNSYVFDTALGGGNVDTIVQFSSATDKFRLAGGAGSPFAAFATGSFTNNFLRFGTAAQDADDMLIYDQATGTLSYDADGNGAGAAVQFAKLAPGTALDATAFIITGDVNHAPTIGSGSTANVDENVAANTIVYQAAASDADGDRIFYSLTGADANRFTIDANGTVRIIASPDFETKASYAFAVVAADSASSTSRNVVLTINDLADNATTPTINETAASNDTQQTAQSIDPNAFVIATNPNLYNQAYPSASIVGSISTPNDVNNISSDVDFYSITLQAGQQLILDVDGTNGLDSFLTLYGPGGVLIGDNDDSPADTGSSTSSGHNLDSQIIFRAATSGTYYFSIKSFVDEGTNQPTSKGDYTLQVSVNSTPATAAQIMAEDVQALVSGASWTHAGPAFNLTYGFPNQAIYYPQTFAEVSSTGQTDPTPTFEGFNATQQAATRSLLQLVANVTQITFTENITQGSYQTAGTAANANLRYAESSEVDGAAYAYYPTNVGPSSVGGSAWFNHKTNGSSDFDNPLRGNYAWMGILHETGHALGLKHGHEFPLAISADHDSLEYSVMTYRSFPGDDINGYNNEQWGYAQTLMMLDIAALQKIYGGANYSFNSDNSTYTWSATTGEMSINGVGQGAPGDGNGITLASENRVFMTIWDGNGNDTYDLSNYNTNVIVDLRPGEWTTTSGTQLANLGPGHFARGNVANALLFEGDLRSTIENAKGGSGADTLIANQVANQLTGNLGTDTFKWMTTGDAGTGGQADTVLDFVRGADKIDFTNLDANPATGAHDAFAFIGTAGFHNVAGEVRYDVTGGSAHIFADVDGNGTADMEIILTNITTLAGTDFNF